MPYIIVKDANGNNQYLYVAGGSGTSGDPHKPGYVPVDTNGNVAIDDAAAAGPLFTMAGLYRGNDWNHTSSDYLDNGDIGRLRASSHRALIVAKDVILVEVANAANASIRDTASHGYSLGSYIDAHLVASMEWVVSAWNKTDQPANFNIVSAFFAWGYSAINNNAHIWNINPFSGLKQFLPYELTGSYNSSLFYVPALRGPHLDLGVTVQHSTAPTTGEWVIRFLGRAR